MQAEKSDTDAVERSTPLRCDFCGAEATNVRRVALDQDYDRLQKPHRRVA